MAKSKREKTFHPTRVKLNKRHMGHIAHLSNTGSYENTSRILIYISFPFVPPDPRNEAMIWTNLLIHYVRKLSFKLKPKKKIFKIFLL
jgi:hypothetical protein